MHRELPRRRHRRDDLPHSLRASDALHSCHDLVCGAFGPYRATFELRGGTRFRLWATSGALSQLERGLANFTSDDGYASETSSSRPSLQ
jgi:hypothetical protein